MKKKSTTNIPAKKSLGQNFLINKGIVVKIVAAGNVKASDTIIEVGPGKGTLTTELVHTGAQVIAIEKDHRLIEDLRERFSDDSVRILEDDVLEIDPRMLPIKAGEYKIIANIPYYITSHFIRDIFEKWPRPSLAVLMVQKEVAQRLAAKPSDMNILALSVQVYADIELVTHVSRGSFAPAPNVDSAVIKLTPKKEIPSAALCEKFFKAVKGGFSQKRKMLINNLERELDMSTEKLSKIFEQNDIPLKIRAEELSLDQWLTLAQVL